MKRFASYLVIILSLLAGTAQAEWYAAGYGGWSAPQSLKDVTMNNFGQRFAESRYLWSQQNVNFRDTLVQNFKTSDVALKQSPLFGGKAGYFFNDQGLSWLGVEIEVFTTTPTIKSQTVSTKQDITYTYGPGRSVPPSTPCPAPPLSVNQCSSQETLNSTLKIPTESPMRLITVAFNVVARYPGKVFQPYMGVGAGAFYFTSSTGSIQGRQVVPGLNAMAGLKVLATEEWGLFLEGKYNRATITNFDPTYGLSGEYSAFNILAGIAYHF